MSTFEFNKNENELFEFEVPSMNEEEWMVVQQESITFDKGEFILEEFKKDFPGVNVTDYDMLCNVASRSKRLSSWLAAANLNYSEMTQLPLFLKDLVDTKQYLEVQTDIVKVKKTVTKYSQERQKLAEEYRVKLKKIEENEQLELNKVKENNQILYALTLNSQYLPLSLQLLIEGYVPTASGTMEESRKVFGRELLIQYKKTLIELYLKDPSINLREVVTLNEVK